MDRRILVSENGEGRVLRVPVDVSPPTIFQAHSHSFGLGCTREK